MKTSTLKGAVQDFSQPPHCAANCLQPTCTHKWPGCCRVQITCNTMCAYPMVRGTAQPLTGFRLHLFELQFIGETIYQGARIAQLVVFRLAVHSVTGSILLWGNFPVEGIFPLELTWVQTPFPQKLFRMRV